MLFLLLQKLFSFLRYLNCCLDFSITYKNGLIRKVRLISEFMTSPLEKQTIAIYILPNISRSKGSQTMKFGQSTVYNMRNIFLEKLYTKCGAETIPRPLSNISKISISLDQQFVQFAFIICQVDRKVLKLSYRPLGLTSYKAF